MYIWGKGRAAGRVRLFVGNRGSGRVNVSPGRVQEKWPVDNSGTTSIKIQALQSILVQPFFRSWGTRGGFSYGAPMVPRQFGTISVDTAKLVFHSQTVLFLI